MNITGDGRTYYEVFKMLHPGAPVKQLSIERVQHFSETMRDNCGRKELTWIDSVGTSIMYNVAMAFNGAPKCYAFDLDDGRVAEAKAKAAADGALSYVSTNDLLTSGFFNACNTRIGVMAMDCRGKLDGITGDMAGNYVTSLVLDSTTFGTPASLRKMYASMPYKTTGRPLPGMCACCGCGGNESNCGQITNWSSFAGALIQLEGCELSLHVPVHPYPPEYICWDEMIPFARGPGGKKGVIIWTVNSDEKGLRETLPIGSCVDSKLFP
jgi:hypothetical protein